MAAARECSVRESLMIYAPVAGRFGARGDEIEHEHMDAVACEEGCDFAVGNIFALLARAGGRGWQLIPQFALRAIGNHVVINY